MTEWDIVQLAELSSTKKYAFTGGPFGSSLVSRDYQPEGVPVIRGGNLPDNAKFSFDDLVFVSEHKADALRSNNAHPGDLIFTQRGTLGQVGLIPLTSTYERFVISQSQMKLTVDADKADALYLYYYFRLPSTVEQINNLAMSSGIPHINLDILKKFKVRLPPLPVQRKIAAILSAYDDLIENNSRRIALLERMAEEVYREWFVRLRFPGHAGVPAHNGVPEGWKINRLDAVVELAYGKALKDEDRIPGDYPVCGSSGIVGSHNQSLVKGPGIVIGRKGNVGSVHWLDADFYPIDTVYYVKSELSLYYLFYAVQSLNFLNNDAAVPGLNRMQAYSNNLFVPPAQLLAQFDSFASNIFNVKANLAATTKVLRQSRDMLLGRLLSGKVEVDCLHLSSLSEP